MTARARKVTRADGTFVGWRVPCPGCRSGHLYDARWTFNGDVERPTFTPSYLATAPGHSTTGPGIPFRCHSYVTDGQIQFLTDCTHELAGKTVPLPDLETQ